MPARRLLAVLAATGGILHAAPAWADEPLATGTLEWHRGEGAEGCIDRDALAARVDRQLGRPAVVDASRGDVAIEGRVERAPGGAPGYRARITAARDGAPLGSRELGTERLDCASLDDSLTLVVALLIDPEHALAPAALPSHPAPLPEGEGGLLARVTPPSPPGRGPG